MGVGWDGWVGGGGRVGDDALLEIQGNRTRKS